MKVADVAWPWVASVPSSEPLERAVWMMRGFEVGCVVVVDDGRLVGILTERDLLRAVAEGSDPHSVCVRDFMTSDPVTIDADEDVVDAAAVMSAVGARHLPVLRGEEIVGLLSIRDLLPVISKGKPVSLVRRSSMFGRRRAPTLGTHADRRSI